MLKKLDDRISERTEALDKLLWEFPNSHAFFGDHASPQTFVLTLELMGTVALELRKCWVFLIPLDGGVEHELHFFCPFGFSSVTVKAVLRHAVEVCGVSHIVGEVPPGSINARRARIAARALGMQKRGSVYSLPKDTILAYTRPVESA